MRGEGGRCGVCGFEREKEVPLLVQEAKIEQKKQERERAREEAAHEKARYVPPSSGLRLRGSGWQGEGEETGGKEHCPTDLHSPAGEEDPGQGSHVTCPRGHVISLTPTARRVVSET